MQRRFGRIAWALALVALALRLAHLIAIAGTPDFQVPAADAELYDRLGQQIAAGDLLAGREAHFLGPFYSYYLGAVYAVAGHRLWVPVALQCLLAAATVLLVSALGRRLLTRRAGLLAAGLLAVLAQAVYFSGLLLMETLLAFLNALALWLVVRDGPAARKRSLLLAGLALGVAATGRPSELALLLPIAAYVAWPAATGRPKAASWRPVIGRLALLALGAAAAVAPVTVRNWVVVHDLVPITFSGGFNFYVGNGPQASGATFILDDLDAGGMNVSSYAQREARRDLSPSQVDAWWRARAFDFIAAHPGRFVRLLLVKVWFFWNALDIPQIEWFTAAAERTPLLRLLPGFPLLGPLSLLGLALTLRRWRTVGVLHASIVIYVATVALFFVTTRYRVAAFPYLCLTAGAALDWGWGALRARRVRALVAAAAATAGLVFLLGSWHLPVDERFTRAQQHIRAAHGLSAKGDVETARRELQVAIRTYPQSWEAHHALGVLEQEAGRLDTALPELLEAARLAPRHPAASYALATTYYKMGRLDEAERAIQTAVALEPYNARMHEYAGVVAAASGRPEEAERRFRRALQLDPDRASAYNNLGTLLGSQQRHDEALELFQTACRKDPSYLPARRNLVLSWLALGRAQQARDELQALLARAPQDTFGLRIRALLRNQR